MLVASKGLQISAGLDGPSSWPCAYCTVVVGSRSALNRHIANIHSPFRTTFTCHLCNAAVSRKDHLWRHIRRYLTTGRVDSETRSAGQGGREQTDRGSESSRKFTIE